MANGIGRKRAFGIAAQTTFGTASATASYWLPIIDWTPGESVMYVENTAMIGSSYEINDAAVEGKMANPSFTLKVDEASFPLLLKTFGTLTTATHSGDDAVYDHTIAFNSSNTRQLYTIFVDDPDRTDLTFDSFRVDSMNISIQRGQFVQVELSGVSRYPVTASHTPSLSEFLEFTAANSAFQMADTGGSLSTVKLLEAELEHNFNVSDDGDNFNLSSLDIEQSFSKEVTFEHSVKLHFPDLTYKDKFRDNTQQQFEAQIIDTGRDVSTSTAGTNPSFTFEYPQAYLSGWTENGGANDVLKQDLKVKPLDKINVADAPVKIVCVNAVSGY